MALSVLLSLAPTEGSGGATRTRAGSGAGGGRIAAGVTLLTFGTLAIPATVLTGMMSPALPWGFGPEFAPVALVGGMVSTTLLVGGGYLLHTGIRRRVEHRRAQRTWAGLSLAPRHRGISLVVSRRF